MEVAVQEPVAVRKTVGESLERPLANVLGHERRAEPVTQLFPQWRQLRRGRDAMKRRMLCSQRPRDTDPDRPRPADEPVEEIDAVHAVEDHAGTAVDGDAARSARYVGPGRVRRRERSRLALDHLAVAGIAGEPEHAPIVPREDLRLAPGPSSSQVVGARRVDLRRVS